MKFNKLKIMCTYFRLSTVLLIAVLITLPIRAQVNIGSEDIPKSFSILELTTKNKEGGLRIPQLTTKERDALNLKSLASPMDSIAKGLVIYNIDTHCLDFWNGTQWVSQCSNVLIPPLSVVISPSTGTVEVGKTVKLTATVTPSNASSIQYRWEYSFDKTTWSPVAGETVSTLAAMALIVGDVYYRVVAYNSAGSATSNIATITGIDFFPTGGDNPNIQMYAGAFWRANEKGERIIQFGIGSGLNNDGNWTVSVIWYDDKWDPDNAANPDGIVLANSSLIALPVSGDAESYPVTGSRVISGTVADGGTITFRIGLDKHFTKYDENNFPARYAVLLLSYNKGAKRYKIFIRQGEGDDYLMRPGDPGTTVNVGTRSYAVKFSPYNLRDQSGSTPNDWDNATPLGTGGGRFTDYPTKAGYFFTFSYTKAFAPDTPSGTINAWNQTNYNQSSTVLWDPSWDACPSGYRRPSDGVNNTNTFSKGAIAGSEIRQSLWVNPPTDTLSNSDNSTWGYYADGYFDRMKPVISLGTTPTATSAVATGSVNVAYAGRLFFNPTTSASLFFPAAGYRFHQKGQLYNAGGRARYWTSSAFEFDSQIKDDWFLYLYSNTDGIITGLYYDGEKSEVAYPSKNSDTSGALVRCVKP